MKIEIRDMLVKALRSPSYKQGGNWLHTKHKTKNRYDALGVLTDLYLNEIGKDWNYIPDKPNYSDPRDIIYVGLSTLQKDAVKNELSKGLSPQVMRWAGVKDPYVEIPTLSNFRNDKRQKLLDAGGTIGGLDDYGFSFKDIAEIIEKTL